MLEHMGYINQTGGNRKNGFEYQVKAWEEYESLKAGIDILDKHLEKPKSKMNGHAATATMKKAESPPTEASA